MAKSTAHAHWSGSLLEGSGHVSTDSPALDNRAVTWRARVGEVQGTTPEELLASAHASCFAMALSGGLAKDGHAQVSLDVDATVEFGPTDDGGFEVKGSHITVSGDVPGIDEEAFLQAAEGAKVGCPISKALAIPVSLDAKLVQHA